MNITQSGLITSSRLDFTSSSLYTRAASGGSFFIPTRDEIKSNHETDKQNEDNTTWFLEYKALLNSKLTTLITSLTSAYVTDLDAAMGTPSKNLNLGWSKKQNMQGNTGEYYTVPPNSQNKKVVLDPGAMRTSFAYIKTFNKDIASSYVRDLALNVPTGLGLGDDNNGSWYKSISEDPSNNTQEQPGTYYIRVPNFKKTIDNISGESEYLDGFSGTTTFITGSPFELERLQVSLNNTIGNASLRPTYIITKIDKDGLETQYMGRNIGNNFLLTLYKFFERPENIDLLKFDMFKDVYVVGTSSLPTGSQVQGSISLNWNSQGGYISIQQERFAAFYHS